MRVLRSGWLTTGKEALAFEREFAAYTGAPHALGVSSATAGLHLALEALELKRGDKVLLPSYTFTASAEVIRYCGADPVFVDIAPGSFNMDPARCEEKIQELQKEGVPLKGIMAVHIAGSPDFLEEHYELSRRYGLFLVEDAAHAFPVPHPRGMVGTWSDAGVYSFYATKTITTGEGGMVVLGDKKLKSRIEKMRLHGIDRPVWDRYTQPESPWEYDVIAPGFKYNLCDLAAAIGREQLKKAQTFLEKRKALVKAYQKGLSGVDWLRLPPWKENHAWHLFMIHLPPEAPLNRNDLIEVLRKEGIGTSVHFKPVHLFSYYRDRYQLPAEAFPQTMALYRGILSLPLYPDMTLPEVERVCKAIKKSPEVTVREK